jgi:mono/diheme cytochrome c family protein
MGAPLWTESSEAWIELQDFLAEGSTAEVAPALEFQIVQPPAELEGGDAEAGREFFNGACSVCHGQDAEGTERAPSLDGRRLDADYVAERVRLSGDRDSAIYFGLTGGRMPFWSADRISDDELRDVIAYVIGTDGSTSDGDDPPPVADQRSCEATHAKVGQVAELTPIFHGVSGLATVVDDCTIEITNFNYDGQGIVVEIYAGLDGDFGDGFSVSDNLVRAGGYSNDTLRVQLPEDKTLDDLDSLSVWCVAVGVSFGDGTLL